MVFMFKQRAFLQQMLELFFYIYIYFINIIKRNLIIILKVKFKKLKKKIDKNWPGTCRKLVENLLKT